MLFKSDKSLSHLEAVLRYLRTDRRMSSVTFNNLVLADGQKHRLLFHLKGLQQQGPGGVELHLDCRLVETVRDLPAAFQGLPTGYGTVQLKTMQPREQVTSGQMAFPYNHFFYFNKGSGGCLPKGLTADFFIFLQESLDELKLAVGDSFESVASLQDCHFQQRDSVQTLGKALFMKILVQRDSQDFPSGHTKTTITVEFTR